MNTLNIAIVGAGPRGLWAVEELIDRAARTNTQVAIDVYNHGPIGAEGAYGRNQPDSWLLNVRSSALSTRMGHFDDWRTDNHDDPFPPRSMVGHYLADAWQTAAAHVPPSSRLRHIEQEVTQIDQDGQQWRIGTTLYDEVLLVTGHAATWPGSLANAQLDTALPVIAPAYPSSQLETITSSDRVMVRGAALTFIDITRSCVAEIFYPVTRSGRFMEVKAGDLNIDRSTKLAQARHDVLHAADTTELTQILADYAEVILRRATGTADPQAIQAVLNGTDGGDPVADLRASYQAATGQRPLTPALAVACAFNDIFNALVQRASFTGRDTMTDLDELTTRLERVAFGPPPESAKHLLDLIDTGRIDTTYLGRGTENIAALADEAGATVIVDGVLFPPGVVEGTLIDNLVQAGHAQLYRDTRALHTHPDGTLVGQDHLAAAGRATEGHVLGNDTLDRTMHDVIPRWAQRVIPTPQHVHGIPPMTARTEPWADELLNDPHACTALIEEFSSPVNVLNAHEMERNIDELVDAAAKKGVELHVFFARKANKALTFVDTVRNAGHGVDVASQNELTQVLARRVQGNKIILSAAIKPDALLSQAIDNDVTISADSVAELERISRLAEGSTAFVAPRLAPDPATMPPTRFGERAQTWADRLRHEVPNVTIVGLHVHLHGYAARDRQTALREAIALTDTLRDHGHAPQFIDLGGGVPMSYLDDKQQWDNYHALRRSMLDGYTQPFTWKSDPLTTTYPYWQEPTRGPWLEEVLSGGIAEALSSRGLRLHLEPGRSLLDGCGVILAEVAFVKTRSDGLPLVGLAMNRTQCRTTSDDYLVDPILVRTHRSAERDDEPLEAYLVGAYCIEDELILRRAIHFPQGVAPGDIIAIPNTAGYFMHILESASHQIPLAKNVVFPPGTLDAIDAPGA